MQHITDEPEKNLTSAEVADILRLGNSKDGTSGEVQVQRLARKGKIPGGVKKGRRWLFDKEIVLPWLKEGITPNEVGLSEAIVEAMALGWDVGFLTDYGGSPSKLMSLIAELRKARSTGRLRGWL